MDPDELIAALEDAYDADHGYVGLARYRQYDERALQQLVTVLRNCPDYADTLIDARLVRLLWWMPSILERQIDGLKNEGKEVDEFARAATAVENELIRILGVP